MIRAFLAVELTDSVRQSLASIQTSLLPHTSTLNVVQSDAMHITLRFLGSVAPARIPDVEAAARAAADRSRPLSLRLTSIGTFPGGRRVPRVIWVGLEPDTGYASLTRLYGVLANELESRGFGRETRAFAPHLTLARVREDRPRAEYDDLRGTIAALARGFLPPAPFGVEELTVFRSDLSPKGPRYTALARLPLAA
jgi:2'-5' RNA ligase